MVSLVSRAGLALYRWCWALAIVLLVILALYASLGRYYVDYLSSYSAQLGQYIQVQTGLELRMTALDGEWSGLSPVVSLEQLDVRHGDEIAARVSGFRGKLGVVSGLFSRQSIDLLELRARRLELHLHQSEAGQWLFAGSPLQGESSGEFDLVSLVLGVREADLRELSLILHYNSGGEARLWGHNLRFAGSSQFRRLKATLGIADSSPTRLIAELSGDPREPDFSLNAYIQLEDSSFKSVAPLFGDYAALADIDGNGELWLSIDGYRQAEWRGRIEVPELALGSLWESEQRLTEANMIFGGVLASGQARGWFEQLDFYWQNQYIDWSGLQVSKTTQADSPLRVVLPQLDVGQMQARLLGSQAMPESLANILSTLAPQGMLRNIAVDVSLENPKEFRLVADLAAIVLESFNGAPSVRGLDGYVELTADQGELSINQADIQLGLPTVYAEALKLQDVTTRLQWAIADERLTLRSGSIQARDGNSSIVGRLGLDIALAADAPKSSSISLLVGLRDGVVEQRDQYLPKVVDDGLRSWLDTSIGQGRVPQAAFLLDGSLNPDEILTVQLALDATQVALDYHPQWPALKNANASLFLDGNTVSVSSDGATIYDDVGLRDIQVDIAAEGSTTFLSISAQADSSVNSALRVVRESALRTQVGSSFDDWRGAGKVRAAIDLRIPLKEGMEPFAYVDTRIDAHRIQLDNLNLDIEDVAGALLFDSRRGLSSPSIRGKLFGRPIDVSVTQTRSRPVQVNIQGTIDVADVRQWLNQPLLGFARGEAKVNIDMSVGEGGAFFRASSDLFGVAIDLPEPLGKPANRSRLFELGVPLASKPLTLDMTIDRLGRLMLAFDDHNQLSGGSFALGNGSIPPPPRGWFMVVGQMEETRLDDWIAVLDRYNELIEEQAPQSRADHDPPMAIVVEDFSIQRLHGLGRTWVDVEIDANNGAGSAAWDVGMRSQRLEGKIQLTPDKPMRIDLQRFNLPEIPTLTAAVDGDRGAAVKSSTSMLAHLNPAELPAVDFSAINLSIADQPLGELAFQLRPYDNGAMLTQIRGNLRGLQLGSSAEPLSLSWVKEGRANGSSLKGPLFVGNIGDVLQNWNFERVMESRQGRADIDIHWRDAPDMLSPQRISGDLSMTFQKGRFLRGSDAASGTLRMVGLLNFANIIRRLQFNFRDIFEKGIHYDSIRGAMNFRDGVMRMPKPIEIDGPSSNFRISGLLDFNTDQTDMELLATLPVGSNLPWVAALISGLPVAAGVYIASKVFEEQVDKVSSIAYRVRGPWQAPELEFKRLFGDAVSIDNPELDATAKSKEGPESSGPRFGRGAPGK